MTIRNDATRLRIVPKDERRPRAVVARQGLALLDTDLDQQSRHQLERIETETSDTLGPPGTLLVPASDPDGFKITPGGTPTTFAIGKGHGYLGGWLLDNATSNCTLATQPHPRANDNVGAPAMIGLKALVRYVDSVEESAFADVALRDAQASGRSLVDWQVFPYSPGGALTCAGDAGWTKLTAKSTGTLTVQEKAGGASNDPCTLTPAGGFNRHENLLYRFEVHGGVPDPAYPQVDGARLKLDGLQLKFSRRNASVMARITKVAGAEITVAAPPLDARNWFAPGFFAEIVSSHDDVDPRDALDSAKVRMYRVALAVDDRVMLEDKPAGAIANLGIKPEEGTWFLRLWDTFANGEGVMKVIAAGPVSQEMDTGDGLVAIAGDGTFRRGDYWTWDARADGSVGWPKQANVPLAMPPHGPEVRYASLGILNGNSVDDCRIPFASLSDRLLVYRGGDGQGVFAPANSGMVNVPAQLRVGVMRGEKPVIGATVRWSYVGPGGGSCTINGTLCDATKTVPTTTDVNGLVSVAWAINSNDQADPHQVQASLAGPQALVVPPIVFTALFDTAARTSYEPDDCKHLVGVTNVQDALRKLCSAIPDDAKRPKVISLRAIVLYDENGKPTRNLMEEEIILNGIGVDPRMLQGGIFFGLDTALDCQPRAYDPIVEIEVDLPYPTTDPDKLYWAQASTLIPQPGQPPTRLHGAFGYQRMRLMGTVKVEKEREVGSRKMPGLVWEPSAEAAYLLSSARQHDFGLLITGDYGSRLKEVQWTNRPVPIPCRIRLRSAHIWANGEEGPIYLNAEYLGVDVNKTNVELSVRYVDPQRAADLDMFIYLNGR